MGLPPIRVVDTNAVPIPFTPEQIVTFVKNLTGILVMHVMAHPDDVARYLRDTLVRNPLQWYVVGTHGCRHLLLKRGAGEYMAVDYTSAAYGGASGVPEGVLFHVQWETPLSDDMYEEALRVEMALVSRLLDEWLEQAAVAHA